MVVPPGLRVPTAKDVAGMVHSLLVYTPRFTAFMSPVRGMVWLLLRTASVVTVRASAVIVSAITARAGIFLIFVFRPSHHNTSLKY